MLAMKTEIIPLQAETVQNLTERRAPVHVYQEIDSTNEKGRQLIMEGAPSGTLILAEKQTKGRGRRGHSFYSPESGLYFTMLYRPENEEAAIAKTTVAAAVSLCEAVEKTAGIACGIKWVNDLYLNGKKIAGILCEAPRDMHGNLPGIIIGIGINVSQKEFPEEIRDIAGSLNRPDLDRNVLAAVLADRLMYWLERLDSEELTERYKAWSAILGKEVSFIMEERTITGIATDINADGNLIVEADRTYTLSSGEISLTSWQS